MLDWLIWFWTLAPVMISRQHVKLNMLDVTQECLLTHFQMHTAALCNSGKTWQQQYFTFIREGAHCLPSLKTFFFDCLSIKLAANGQYLLFRYVCMF